MPSFDIFFLNNIGILVPIWNDLSKLPPKKNLEMIFNNPHHWIPSTTKKLSVIKPMPAIAEAIIMQATWLKPSTFSNWIPIPFWPSQLVVTRASPPPKEHIRNQQEKSPLAKIIKQWKWKGHMRSGGHNHQLTGWQIFFIPNTLGEPWDRPKKIWKGHLASINECLKGWCYI